MFRRIRKLALWPCLVLLGNSALAQQSHQLAVSATVPPRSCQYPENCEPAPADATTKVTIDDGEIRYVGPPPEVSQDEDLLTIMF